MKIDSHYGTNDLLNHIDVHLYWNDFELLKSGGVVGDRYDGENKLEIEVKYPVITENYGSWVASFRKKEFAVMNRDTRDIRVVIPEGVLRNSFFISSSMECTDYPGGQIGIKVFYPSWDDVETTMACLEDNV